MKTTRILSLLVAFAMLLSCAAALAEVEPEFPFSEEPITLTFFVQSSANEDEFLKRCEESILLQRITEKTTFRMKTPVSKSGM